MDNPPFGAKADAITDFPSLRFSPVGLYDLRRNLGRPAGHIYRTYRNRFDASDIAWFAAGLASLPCDALGPMDFPPEIFALREQTPDGPAGSNARKALRARVSELTFDMAALWDRAFGGTTLVIHVDGTTRPGSLKRPDFIKSEVYFPGYLLNLPDHAAISATIADIVQRFIVDIGVSTVTRYEQRARRLFGMSRNNRTQMPYSSHPIQPPADPANSSIFEYHGRLPVVVVDEDDDTTSHFEYMGSPEVVALTERLKDANAALKVAEDALAKSLQREQALQAQLERLSASSSSSSTAPRTPRRPKASSSGSLVPNFASPASVMVHSPIARPPRPAIGSVNGQLHSSPAATSVFRANVENDVSQQNTLAEFVHSRGLGHSFALIDLTRRNVAPYLWQSELRNELQLDQNDLEDLMAAMVAYSTTQSDGKDC